MLKNITACTKCRLHEKRTQVVVGRGNEKNAKILFIGEAPGSTEDEKGIPFVGPSGKILNEWIKYLELEENDYYITNIVKCQHPQNRDPRYDEKTACNPYLLLQIAEVDPEVIVFVGRQAAQFCLKIDKSMYELSGKELQCYGRKAFALYHPAAILRHFKTKQSIEEDLDILKKLINP